MHSLKQHAHLSSSRIIKVQTEMAERALELLALPEDGTPRLILDLGCGSGLSGNVLEAHGHLWIGIDVSRHMLGRCKAKEKKMRAYMVDVTMERLNADQNFMDIEEESDPDDDDDEVDEDDDDDEEEDDDDDEEDSDYENHNANGNDDRTMHNNQGMCLDLFLGDMGNGACFRPGMFDGVVSISALQWLCHSNRSDENPKARLSRLFTTLFGSLARGARAIFQFYPERSSQIDLIMACATKAGFTGGLVIDYPNSSKAKKYYLCLMTGPTCELPRALTEGEQQTEASDNHISIGKRKNQRWERRIKQSKKVPNRRQWVLQKKELSRKRGLQVKEDSKYTARKRRPRF